MRLRFHINVEKHRQKTVKKDNNKGYEFSLKSSLKREIFGRVRPFMGIFFIYNIIMPNILYGIEIYTCLAG